MGAKLEQESPIARVHRQRVDVSFEYPVYFTRRVFAAENPSLCAAVTRREPTRRHRVYCVIDDGVARAWPGLDHGIAGYFQAHAEQLELLAAPRIVPGGERIKQSSAEVDALHAELQRCGVDRQSFVMAIGGGAMLDAVGYAAATTHRGVRLLRLPTTVLAQNDSGVGVKNGINAFGAKNFLGSFAPPFAVINDAEFLTTLAPRDLRAGLAEAVKVALIRDAEFFAWLEHECAALAAFQPGPLEHSVRIAAQMHLRHIAEGGDPFELGSARPLDFGHWAAHKLEALTAHELRHGEAVAIGMALDSRYSTAAGLMPEAELERVCALLEGLGFTLWHDTLAELDSDETPRVLAGLGEFREHLGGELTLTLLAAIGRGVEVHDVAPELVVGSIDWLRDRHAARIAARGK